MYTNIHIQKHGYTLSFFFICTLYVDSERMRAILVSLDPPHNVNTVLRAIDIKSIAFFTRITSVTQKSKFIRTNTDTFIDHVEEYFYGT